MSDAEKREMVIRGLKMCVLCRSPKDCVGCPYEGERTHAVPCGQVLMADALALLKEQEPEIKGLRKLVEWAVECDFGYDNLGDWWVDRFKSEIEGMSYTEGLIHLAKRYVEIFEGGDGDGD